MARWGGYRGRYASKRRSWTSTKRAAQMAKPTAENQKKQIVALAGGLQRVQRRMQIGKQISQYAQNYDYNLAADYGYHDLVVPTAWTNIFTDPESVENATRVQTKGVKLDMLFTCHSEMDPTDLSVFVVSLKPETADQLLDIAGSDLASMVAGAHYAKVGTYSGQVFLNEQFFNIHRTYKFSITGTLQATTVEASREASASFKRISTYVPWSRKLWSGRNDWRDSLTSARVASSAKLYVLMFNNNSAVDLNYPHVTTNAVWKVEAF